MEVVYKLFLVLIFGALCVLVLYGFCVCFCYSRCRSSLGRAGWVPRPCLMLWGIISCSIPSQEGVCVFFILFSYVHTLLLGHLFFRELFIFLFVWVVSYRVFYLSSFTARSLGAKKLMGERIKSCFRFILFVLVCCVGWCWPGQ